LQNDNHCDGLPIARVNKSAKSGGFDICKSSKEGFANRATFDTPWRMTMTMRCPVEPTAIRTGV
jgi:hypothetical protein